MYKILILLVSLIYLISCSNKDMENFDIQGHRGCRGLLPENTIPAFLKACELGVTTLEMDVVITADGHVLVSHEPFFNHEISMYEQKDIITEENEKQYNIYQMISNTIEKFDVGLKFHPRFPNQEKMAVTKPLLKNVVKAVEKAGYNPLYNIEIKRVKVQDDIFHPSVTSFTNRVVETIKELGIMDRTTIQSFDHESLNIAKALDKSAKTVMLVEDDQSLAKHLSLLDHQPYAYSPNYELVNAQLVESCHKKGIKIIPWTVNEVEDMQKLINLGVDGIITDYPDRLIDIVK